MVKLFGSTIKETYQALFSSAHFGEAQVKVTQDDKTKAIGRVVVSILLILAATYFISSGLNKDLGSTIVGALIGYWLK